MEYNKVLITANELQDIIHDDNLILLDASLQKTVASIAPHYKDLQIIGARYFDLKNVFSQSKEGISNLFPSVERFQDASNELGITNESQIIVYDNSGVYASPRVWWLFKTMGIHIRVLDGGLPSWIAIGGKVTKREQNINYSKGHVKVNYQDQLIWSTNNVLKHLDDHNSVFIDARSPERYLGLVEEPRPGLKKGHIPKAKNIYFNEVLENGCFKSKAELISIFKEISADKNKVIYCGSGVTACIVLLAAHIVNINHLSLYDASWLHWGRLEDQYITSL